MNIRARVGGSVPTPVMAVAKCEYRVLFFLCYVVSIVSVFVLFLFFMFFCHLSMLGCIWCFAHVILGFWVFMELKG